MGSGNRRLKSFNIWIIYAIIGGNRAVTGLAWNPLSEIQEITSGQPPVSFEVNTPPISAGVVRHLKLGEDEKVLGKQIVRRSKEPFWNQGFPFFNPKKQ
jgi:hypothetical protein